MTDDRVSPDSPGTTATSLIDRVRRLESAAWDELVTLYTPLVVRRCRRAGMQSADVADVTQDVFRSVFLSLDTFRRDRPGQSFRAWLRVVAHTRICDWARARPAAAGGHELLHAVPAPDDSDPDNEREEMSLLHRQALDVVRSRVKAQTWQAFWRVTMDEADVETVAAELNLSANSVYLAKSRVLRQLRDLLSELGENAEEAL